MLEPPEAGSIGSIGSIGWSHPDFPADVVGGSFVAILSVGITTLAGPFLVAGSRYAESQARRLGCLLALSLGLLLLGTAAGLWIATTAEQAVAITVTAVCTLCISALIIAVAFLRPTQADGLMFGWTRVVEAAPKIIVDQDPDPQIGELLEVDLVTAKRLFLRVTCGTGRRFVLPMPPTMTTALEANAWSYGIAPQDLMLKEHRT
jgi:hypothetical protein